MHPNHTDTDSTIPCMVFSQARDLPPDETSQQMHRLQTRHDRSMAKRKAMEASSGTQWNAERETLFAEIKREPEILNRILKGTCDDEEVSGKKSLIKSLWLAEELRWEEKLEIPSLIIKYAKNELSAEDAEYFDTSVIMFREHQDYCMCGIHVEKGCLSLCIR